MKPESHNIFVGPAGWQYPDWNGTVYPESRPRGFDALEYISSYFNLIEINSTFYRTPARDIVRRWVDRTAHRHEFRFTLKANRAFTHGRALPSPDEFSAFASAVQPMQDAGRLISVLVQFPWSFRFDEAARRRIKSIRDSLPKLPLVLEVRHGSWMRDDGREYLDSLGLAVCGVDQPVIGDSIRPLQYIAGTSCVYFRLHGRNYRDWFRNDAGRDARYDYHYSRRELEPWVAAIRAASKTSDVTVVLNNHFRGQAPANAFEIMAMLTGEKPVAPGVLRRTFPGLRDTTTQDPSDGTEPPTTGWLFDPDNLSSKDDEE